MSNPADHSAARSEALGAFDTARDDFLAAFAAVPDEALSYLPAGDEYALGVLPMHLCDSMRRYLGAFDRIQQAGYGPVDLAADAALAEREAQHHRELVASRPTGADRPHMLDELRATHGQVRRHA